MNKDEHINGLALMEMEETMMNKKWGCNCIT